MNELLLEVANQKEHKTRGWRIKVCNFRAGHRGYIVTFDYGTGCDNSEFISYDDVFEYMWEELCKMRQSKN